jgi:hypothetical protein
MQISVIICTYNPREKALTRVLQGLREQTLPIAQWELIIVDNASKIPVDNSVDIAWHPHGKVLREEELGKMHAWFKGMSEAKGDILIFVDDDNLLDRDYLEQAIAIGTEWPFVGAWGGGISPEFEVTPPAWCLEQPWRLAIDEVKEDVWSNLRDSFATHPAGAGMCIRKEVGARYLEWCRAHEMSNALDRVGNVVTGYGDMNLALCAIDLGMGTGKTPRLHLTHLIPSSRLTLDYLIRQAEGDAMSLLMYRELRGLPVKEPNSSFLSLLKQKAFRLISSRPKELFVIDDAYQRGLKKGWELVQKYRKHCAPTSK